MAGHRHSDSHALDAEDPAFQPRSSFDFEEEMQNHARHPFNTYSSANGNYDLSPDFDDEFDSGFFHEDHLDYAASTRLGEEPSKGDYHGPLNPPSGQGHIISSRHGQVSQFFGQITPPNDFVPQPFKAPQSKQADSQASYALDTGGKLSNEQRARNAANTRHSRRKSTKKKSAKEEDTTSDAEVSQKYKNLNLQREKNRVAAAKCRAKKKTANEQQEEMANEFGATNNVLTREIRELKNQRTELQNYLLAHRPGVCECHGIHDYNFGQAQRLVLNARRQAAVPSPSSPSQESALSAPSSGSDVAGMMFSRPSPMMPEAVGMNSRAQSFNAPIEFGFNPLTNPDEQQEMHREFAEFLRSSPNGRAGLS